MSGESEGVENLSPLFIRTVVLGVDAMITDELAALEAARPSLIAPIGEQQAFADRAASLKRQRELLQAFVMERGITISPTDLTT